MGFRLVVDRTSARATGSASPRRPSVFEVDRERMVQLLDPTPPDDQRRAAELAVRYCPTHALSIVDDD